MVLFDHLLMKTEGFNRSCVPIAVTLLPLGELNRRFLSIHSLKPTCSAQVCAVVCHLTASSLLAAELPVGELLVPGVSLRLVGISVKRLEQGALGPGGRIAKLRAQVVPWV